MELDLEAKQTENGKKERDCPILREPFQILTLTLLSLLLPLSFLILARLSTVRYLLAISADPPPQDTSLLLSLFLHTDSTFLHVLVPLVSVAALVHGLSGQVIVLRQSTKPSSRPRLFAAWIFLCTIQVCVGLGIEGSIAAGVTGSDFGRGRSFMSRVVFFLGLHETMLFWSRTVVKPVVDDTVFGFERKERWAERVGLACIFGTLWWCRLRDEIETLVIVPEVKRDLLIGVGVADFVGWWLYYLTVTIGIVRVVKGVVWIGMILLCKRRGQRNSTDDSPENLDKV